MTAVDVFAAPRWRLPRTLPGLAVSAGLAAFGLVLWQASGRPGMLSPMVAAMLAGALIGNLGLARPALGPGIALALRPVLRAGIVLLGFRLTLGDLGAIGFGGLAAIVALVVSTFLVTRRLGNLLGVPPQLSELIAAGTSICGASAVLGMNTVTRARDEDVAYAIACVTIFGSLAMLGLPLAGAALGLGDPAYGLWAGGTAHEVAQAVAAGFARGEVAGETATVAKLCRVLMLAPMILGVGLMRSRQAGAAGRLPVPWFVGGFLAAMLANTAIDLPEGLLTVLQLGSTFLLAMALGAMGLETRVARLRHAGLRPLLLGCLGWGFIAAAGLALVLVLA